MWAKLAIQRHQLIQGQLALQQAVIELELLFQTRTPALQTSRSSTPDLEASVAEPKDYDGRYETFDAFMCQLYLLFTAKLRTYADDYTKIISALSYMKKGVAGVWATNITKQLSANSECKSRRRS